MNTTFNNLTSIISRRGNLGPYYDLEHLAYVCGTLPRNPVLSQTADLLSQIFEGSFGTDRWEKRSRRSEGGEDVEAARET
jgi:hypothetical protein